jgi:hypothetical protein
LSFRAVVVANQIRLANEVESVMRRRPADEPAIGHLKNSRMSIEHNDLHHRNGDANGAVLAAVATTSGRSLIG